MEAMTSMIFMVPFDWAPNGWMTCQGQVLSINQYQALFSLVGNLYGGEMNKGTFGIPNLSGRTAIGQGLPTGGSTRYAVSNVYGTETTTLAAANLPPHTHPATFAPTMGSQNVTIPAQTGDLAVTMNALTSGAGTVTNPSSSVMLAAGNKIFATAPAVPTTPPPAGTVPLAAASTTVTGTPSTKDQVVSVNTVTGGTVAVGANSGGTPFSTLQPSLALNFIITITGLYPQRPN